MTVFIMYLIHFFLSGFAQFNFVSSGKDGISVLIFLAILGGGIYLIGWSALLTFFFGGMMGGFVYANSQIKDNDL